MKASAENYTSESEVGGGKPADGTYHVVVKEGVQEVWTRKDGSLVLGNDRHRNEVKQSKVPCEILAGTVPGQEGKEILVSVKFAPDGSPGEQHVRLLMATGVLRPKESRDVDFDGELPGKQFVVAIESYESNGKKGQSVANFGEAIWHVNNKEVAAVPKNAAALTMLATAQDRAVAAQAKAGGNGNGNGSQGGGPSASQSAAVDANNDFSDV